MFKDLLESLKQLDGMKVSVPVVAETDADGFVDRQCPATECEFLFKVQEEDWRDIVTDEAVWCPFCGHEAKSDEWWTHEQIEKAKEAAFAEVKHTINKAMRRDAERFNRRQPRRSFISMSMKVDAKPKEIVLPAAATDPMQLKIKCPECACRYAVIGSAYFVRLAVTMRLTLCLASHSARSALHSTTCQPSPPGCRRAMMRGILSGC
jgi:hypothetical protein